MYDMREYDCMRMWWSCVAELQCPHWLCVFVVVVAIALCALCRVFNARQGVICTLHRRNHTIAHGWHFSCISHKSMAQRHIRNAETIHSHIVLLWLLCTFSWIIISLSCCCWWDQWMLGGKTPRKRQYSNAIFSEVTCGVAWPGWMSISVVTVSKPVLQISNASHITYICRSLDTAVTMWRWTRTFPPQTDTDFWSGSYISYCIYILLSYIRGMWLPYCALRVFVCVRRRR